MRVVSTIWSVLYRIKRYLDRLQRNHCKKQFIETSLKNLIWIWVTFPLPTIILYSNNTIIVFSHNRSSGVKSKPSYLTSLCLQRDSNSASIAVCSKMNEIRYLSNSMKFHRHNTINPTISSSICQLYQSWCIDWMNLMSVTFYSHFLITSSMFSLIFTIMTINNFNCTSFHDIYYNVSNLNQ